MFKKTVVLTRPTPACQDTTVRGTAAARSATRRNNEVHDVQHNARQVCERARIGERPVSSVCGRRRGGEPAVSWGRIVIIFTRPPRACRDKLFSRGRTLRGARRRISRLKFAHGRETVSAQCLLSDARTMLAGLFQHPVRPRRRSADARRFAAGPCPTNR